MKTNVTVTAKLGEYKITTSVEIGSDDYIKEQILEALQDENPEAEDLERDNIEYEVTDWEDLDDYKSLQDPSIFKEIADYNGYNDLDVLNSAVELGIQISDVDEAYSGHFEDDEDFAVDMAEQLGESPKENHWPHYCIDWEYAAKELMMDYSVANGNYFRNL